MVNNDNDSRNQTLVELNDRRDDFLNFMNYKYNEDSFFDMLKVPEEQRKNKQKAGAFSRVYNYWNGIKREWDTQPINVFNVIDICNSAFDQFCLGSGVKFSSESGSQEFDDFIWWWNDRDMDRLLSIAIQEMLTAGLYGLLIRKDFVTNEIHVDNVSSTYYYPIIDYNGINYNNISLWFSIYGNSTNALVDAFGEDANNLFYLAKELNFETKPFFIKNTVFEKNESGEVGKERPEVRNIILPNLASTNGEEKIAFSQMPLILFENNVIDDQVGLGKTDYEGVLGFQESLVGLDTIATLEFMLHHNSLKFLPMSMRHSYEKGLMSKEERADIIKEDPRNIFGNQGDIKPEYITKDMSANQYLIEERQSIFRRISAITKVPTAFLESREGEKELLGVALLSSKPFQTKCSRIQKELTKGINKIIDLYFEGLGKKRPKIEIKLPEVIPKDETAEKQLALDAYSAQMIDRQTGIKITQPHLTDEQAKDIDQKAQKEFNITIE